MEVGGVDKSVRVLQHDYFTLNYEFLRGIIKS